MCVLDIHPKQPVRRQVLALLHNLVTVKADADMVVAHLSEEDKMTEVGVALLTSAVRLGHEERALRELYAKVAPKSNLEAELAAYHASYIANVDESVVSAATHDHV